MTMRWRWFIGSLCASTFLYACANNAGFGIAARPLEMQSSAAPQTQQPSLLYVSNYGSSSVTEYTYLNGGGLLFVGSLTGFKTPAGMCTDGAGNVWITDDTARNTFEYAHGGSKPIFSIHQSTGYPYDCAVDPVTGNLAVTSRHPNGKYQSFGNVVIYPKGSRDGRVYSRSGGFKDVFFLAYDNKGNLYLDATPCLQSGCYYSGGPPGLYELANGASEFSPLTFNGATLNEPTAINWVNPTLLVGDQDFQGQGTPGAYKVFVSGSTATVVGLLPFKGTQQANGFWRRAGRVIVPDQAGNIVRIYNLSDGSLFSKLTTEISAPFGAVVSQSN